MKENKQEIISTRPARGFREAALVLGNPRALCLAGVLCAMSIVLGKFLQIPTPFSQIIRISFENLPVILAGMVLGPIAGAMTGAVADLVGCLLYGYAINPIITLGATLVGLCAGTAAWLLHRLPLLARVVISVTLAHLFGSVLVKTAGLAAWYLASFQMGYAELLFWRALNYVIIATLESVLLYFLLRHRGVAKQLERMCRR